MASDWVRGATNGGLGGGWLRHCLRADVDEAGWNRSSMQRRVPHDRGAHRFARSDPVGGLQLGLGSGEEGGVCLKADSAASQDGGGAGVIHRSSPRWCYGLCALAHRRNARYSPTPIPAVRIRSGGPNGIQKDPNGHM